VKKSFLFSLFALLLLCKSAFSADIDGFWLILNQKTQQPRCVVAIYEHGGKWYGRIIGSYDIYGKLSDTIYDPKDRAPGVAGNPFYSGLDFIWNLRNRGVRYKGKIMDPEKGNVYNAEVWREGENLVVRGELLVFGKSQTWTPFPESDFSPKFKKPDLKHMVPEVPRVR
jgi:hypothetical protein